MSHDKRITKIAEFIFFRPNKMQITKTSLEQVGKIGGNLRIQGHKS